MSASREKKMRKQTQSSASAAKTENKKKSLKTVLYSVIAVAVIALVVFFTLMNANFFEANAKVAVVSGHELTAADVNYWLMDTYSEIQTNMQSDSTSSFDTTKSLKEQKCTVAGYETQTWYDYVLDQALQSAAVSYAIYDEAVNSGFSLSESGNASIESQLQMLDMSASMYGFSDGNAYLTAAYGKGCRLDSYKEYLTVTTTAQEYQTSVLSSFSFTDEELQAYYDTHANENDLVRFRVYEIAAPTETAEAEETIPTEEAIVTDEASETVEVVEGTESADTEATAEDVSAEDAEAQAAAAEADAKAMMEASISEDAFLEEVMKRVPAEEQAAFDPDYETISLTTKADAIAYYGEWFNEEHAYGDVTVISHDHGHHVIFFLGTVSRDTALTDVRHILVRAEAADGSLPTDEAYAEAYPKAQSILDEYRDGEPTEEAFAALATSYTEDPGSTETGGLYEALDPSQMVTTFANWAYEDHIPGDTEIIKTEYGYHIMYFVGTSDAKYGDSISQTGLSNEKANEWIANVESSITYDLMTTKYINDLEA